MPCSCIENIKCSVFSWEPALWTLKSQDRVLRPEGEVKKTTAIFGYKQRILSIEMKTKLVQHVKNEWLRDWESVRVRKSESERLWEWLLSIDMKTKVVQHVPRKLFKISNFQIFKILKIFPGSQLLSDCQTFVAGTSSRNSKLTGCGGGPKKGLLFSPINSDFWA